MFYTKEEIKKNIKNLYSNLKLFRVMFDNPEAVADKIIECYSEPHRFFHTLDHLHFLIDKIQNYSRYVLFFEEEHQILLTVAAFHDIVYNPKRKDNEEKSIALMLEWIKKEVKYEHSYTLTKICSIIMDTKEHKSSNPIGSIFVEFDNWPLYHSTLQEAIKYENQIFKEFQYYDYPDYRNGRLGFLIGFKDPKNAHVIDPLINYIKARVPKIGVYAGSFNPLHKGHFNIIEKAEKIFDKVIVAVGQNPDKSKNDLWNHRNYVQARLPYREVQTFDGFLTSYIQRKNCLTDVTLIRGLRNGFDFAYEQSQLRFMEEMYPELKVVYIPCDKEFEHISSSAIRAIDKIDPEKSKRYLVEDK